jgi:acetyl-CoA carboxylase carboxyltransferase component
LQYKDLLWRVFFDSAVTAAARSKSVSITPSTADTSRDRITSLFDPGSSVLEIAPLAAE